MKTSLSEFIAEVNRSRKSGLLSITVKGANTLLKLFFREGEVYHATCGNVKGWGCMAQVSGHEFADFVFMPDVSLNIQEGDILPLTEIIQFFRTAGAVVETQPFPGPRDIPQLAVRTSSPAGMEEVLKLALTRQIGPAGAKVLRRIMEQQWQPASPPGREDFLNLVDLLKNEIENADDRNEFLKEARAILS